MTDPRNTWIDLGNLRPDVAERVRQMAEQERPDWADCYRVDGPESGLRVPFGGYRLTFGTTMGGDYPIPRGWHPLTERPDDD